MNGPLKKRLNRLSKSLLPTRPAACKIDWKRYYIVWSFFSCL